MTKADLIQWRHERLWTQARAAEWYGISERQWRRWELGESPVPAHVDRRLQQLDTILGKPVTQETANVSG